MEYNELSFMVPIWRSNANYSMTKPMSQWHECPKKRQDMIGQKATHIWSKPSPNLSPSHPLCLSLSLSLFLSLQALLSTINQVGQRCWHLRPTSLFSQPGQTALNIMRKSFLLPQENTFLWAYGCRSYYIPTKQGKVDAKTKNTS